MRLRFFAATAIAALLVAPAYADIYTLPPGGTSGGGGGGGAVTIAAGAVSAGAYPAGALSDGAIATLGLKADAKSTATDTTPITIMQVLKQISASVQAPPSQAVTNAGTFAVQLSGATNNINNIAGTISLPTGAATSANQTNATQKTQIVDGSGNVIASTSNNMNVQCANCSGSGVSTGDEASFTAGTSLFAGTGGFFQTTATSNPLTTGQQGMFQVTAQRSLFVNLRNASGAELGVAAAPVQVSLANTGANGTAVAVSAASLPLPTGAATAALQSGVQGTIGAGTAPANVVVVGGQYNSSAPTPTTGQTLGLQMDSSGNAKVVGVGIAIASTTSGQTGSLIMGAVTTANPSYTTAQSDPLSLDVAGGLRIAGEGAAGTATGGVVTVQGVASMTPVQVSQATAANLNATVVGTGTFVVQAAQATAASLNATVVGTGTFATQAQPTPVTTGGLSVFFVQPTASDNHANIKNGAGQVYHVKATNNSATVNYLRLYNAGTGFNGCNSATNLVDQWAIPASTSGAGYVEDIAVGEAFATGISICVTSGYATTDTTNATASAMSVSVGYK